MFELKIFLKKSSAFIRLYCCYLSAMKNDIFVEIKIRTEIFHNMNLFSDGLKS